MIKSKIKKENGFVASDALIAILIIALFTGLIATIVYNIYISNASIKRIGTASEYITNIFENIDKLYYDDISVDGLESYINENQEFFNITNNQVVIYSNNPNEIEKTIGNNNNPSYIITIYIEYYNKTEGNENKLDLVKQITVTTTYKLGNRNQKIKMERIKSRETLATPNKPDIGLLNVSPELKVYPIKNINGSWKICNENDISWNDYEKGNWATIIVSNKELQLNDEVTSTDGNIYVWIPRYAYDVSNNSIVFLYSNTNNFVDNTNEYSSLTPILDTFAIPVDFTNNGEEIGIWVNDTTSGAYANLNAIYPRQI